MARLVQAGMAVHVRERPGIGKVGSGMAGMAVLVEDWKGALWTGAARQGRHGLERQCLVGNGEAGRVWAYLTVGKAVGN